MVSHKKDEIQHIFASQHRYEIHNMLASQVLVETHPYDAREMIS